MWRHGVIQLALVGLMVTILGMYWWKRAQPVQRPEVSQVPVLPSNAPHSPAQTPWSSGVGEVPSFNGDSSVAPGVSASDSPRDPTPHGPIASQAQTEAPPDAKPSSSGEPSEDKPSPQELPPPGLLPLPSEPKAALAASEYPALSDPPQANRDQEHRSEYPEYPEAPEAPLMDASEETGPLNPAPPTETSHALSQKEPLDVVADTRPPSPMEQTPGSSEQKTTENQSAAHPIHFARVDVRFVPPSPSDQEVPAETGSLTPPAEPAGLNSPIPSAPDSERKDLPAPEDLSSPGASELTSTLEKMFPETEPKHPLSAGSSRAVEEAGPKASEKKKVSESPRGCSAQSGCCCRAAAEAHKTLFYENRFNYLDDCCQEGSFLGDSLKRLQATSWATLDIGGEYRLRHHSERNHRGVGLTGQDDDFLLHRTRIYANLELGEVARIYAEMNDALSTNETYLPRPQEEDRTELQNLFIDVPLLGFRSDGLAARLGRQELLYGAGRLVSPLDWANSRRTFEGYKLFCQGPLWTVDAFWARPIYPNPDAFDTPDQSQQFMGLYLVRQLGAQAVLEGYYLRLVEEDVEPGDFDFHTLGLRSQQEYNGWLGELEAAVQFGSYGAIEHTAGMYTIGVGRRFCCLPGAPIFWVYYDWASGDRTLGNGFHHLMPDSHQYLGWMDLFGRRNIEDLNFHLLVHPHRDWTVRLAWHIFHRQNPLDVPYGVDMMPLVGSPGGSGDYGQELDVVLQWAIRPRAEMSFGYSRFFAGEFFRSNPSPAPYQDDADFFYTQLILRF